MASPAESPKVSRSSNHGVIVRVIVVAASTMAIPSIHISVRRISLRRSKMHDRLGRLGRPQQH